MRKRGQKAKRRSGAKAALRPWRHPLVGTWIEMSGVEGRSEFTVVQDGALVRVSGRDYVDGEPYEISNLFWNDRQISFNTLMRSTGRAGTHLFESLPKRATRCRSTFSFTETAKWGILDNKATTMRVVAESKKFWGQPSL